MEGQEIRQVLGTGNLDSLAGINATLAFRVFVGGKVAPIRSVGLLRVVIPVGKLIIVVLLERLEVIIGSCLLLKV